MRAGFSMFYPSKLKLMLPLENPLVVYPQLAEVFGLNESIVIQQIHYWLKNKENSPDHIINDCVWVYNTYEKWKENFPFWSIETIKRLFTSLKNSGIIRLENLNKDRQNQTKWVTIHYEVLIQVFNEESLKIEQRKIQENKQKQAVNTDKKPECQNDTVAMSNCHSEDVKMTLCYTETTTETTSDISNTYKENPKIEKITLNKINQLKSEIKLHPLYPSIIRKAEEKKRDVDEELSLAINTYLAEGRTSDLLTYCNKHFEYLKTPFVFETKFKNSGPSKQPVSGFNQNAQDKFKNATIIL